MPARPRARGSSLLKQKPKRLKVGGMAVVHTLLQSLTVVATILWGDGQVPVVTQEAQGNWSVIYPGLWAAGISRRSAFPIL